MQFPMPAALAAGAIAVLLPRVAAAQLDYRNLDDDRPVRVEDAYPVEWRSFEFNLPYSFTRRSDGATLHSSVLELTWGVVRDAQVGVKVPLASMDDAVSNGAAGVSGIRLFALYNFNTDAPSLPALSLRGDVQLPAGSLGPGEPRGGVTAIATRSFGRTRVHLNGAVGIGAEGQVAAAEHIPDWWAGGAVDRTLVRSSVLLIGEVYALQETESAPTEVNASLGMRLQLTPTLVIDAGVTRRLRDDGPDVGLSVGLSHAFAVAGLMGGRRAR